MSHESEALRELRLPAELLPAHGQVRVKLPERLGLGCWAELLTCNREQREATAELSLGSGERVRLLFTGEPGALYQLAERPPSPEEALASAEQARAEESEQRAEQAERRAEELRLSAARAGEAELEASESACRELRESVGRALGEPLGRSELLARVRRGLPLPLGVAGTHVEEELREEVAREREQLSRYSAALKRSQERAEQAESLLADRLGRSGEGFPAWQLEEPAIPSGGLGAELLEAARERMSGASWSGGAGAGLELAYGDCTGEPYLWRGQLGSLVFSGGGLEGERESWSSALLFLSTSEAKSYLSELRGLDVELYAEELEEGASPVLSSYAKQAAEKALALLS